MYQDRTQEPAPIENAAWRIKRNNSFVATIGINFTQCTDLDTRIGLKFPGPTSGSVKKKEPGTSNLEISNKKRDDKVLIYTIPSALALLVIVTIVVVAIVVKRRRVV